MSKKPRDRSWPQDPHPLGVSAIDNHTHLDSIHHVLPDDQPIPTTADHIARARAVGVTHMVQIGCDLDSAAHTIDLITTHPELVGGIAIHPNEAPLHAGIREIAPDGLAPKPLQRHSANLDDAMARIAELATHERIRTISETGLDFFRGGEQARAVQREAFRAHIALAKELDLPMQIHDREAHADILEVLRTDGAPRRTVFHCFSGDAAMARECVEQGWFLSFSGTVTFRANEELRRAAQETPLEHLLVETDAPYLTPHPFRGRPNAPYLLPNTLRTLAEVKELSDDDVARATTNNALALYGPW